MLFYVYRNANFVLRERLIMDNLVILLLTYVFIIILGFIRGVKNDEDEFSGVTIILDISLLFITIATFVITIYSTSTNLTTVIFLAINIIAVIISWTAKEVYNKLFLEEKKVKTKTLKKVIYKNYSKQHADLVLKFYKLLVDGKYAERLGDIRYPLHVPYELENRNFSYWADNQDRVNIIKRLVEFVNLNIKYSDHKDYAESAEAILLEKENAKRVVFIMNVLEDKEKMEFLTTEEGKMQLKIIGNDLVSLNNNIVKNVEKFVEITKKTKANKMNEDFNLLRKNSFDEIEEMRRD